MRSIVQLVFLASLLAATSLSGQQSETMRVNADRVNVRSAPSIDSSIVRSVSKGALVTVLTRDGAWAKIQVQGQTTAGWVRSDLLVAVPGTAAPQAKPGSTPATTNLLPAPPPATSAPVSPPPPAPVQRAIAPPPAPRPSAPTADYKDPGTATLISVLITGGGQFYAGDTGRGLIMFAIGDGAIILGCGIASSGGSLAPCELGLVVALGTYIYSIADAAPTARRMNELHGARVSVLPIVIPTSQPRVGVALSIRF